MDDDGIKLLEPRAAHHLLEGGAVIICASERFVFAETDECAAEFILLLGDPETNRVLLCVE